MPRAQPPKVDAPCAVALPLGALVHLHGSNPQAICGGSGAARMLLLFGDPPLGASSSTCTACTPLE
eukprot:scaffold17540_cov129-Isochrysis_galbana.AAC.2